MIQNLKIDIIYYDTPTDFEFEFNLGGCCHSRVLNNRTSSPKEMIECLSKAVGRSRVILMVGKLDGSDGLYSLISKAIGVSLCDVDPDEYGIASKSSTTVIENSLPLVSSDGILAGCIIESGPQSIILLPDGKSIRKDVCENLVFQYITAVSRTPDTETVITSDSAEEDNVSVENPSEEVVAEDIADGEVKEESDNAVEEEFEEILTAEKAEEQEEFVDEKPAEEEAEEVNPEAEFIDIFADDNDSREDSSQEEPSDDDFKKYEKYEKYDDEEYDEYEEYDEDDYSEPKPASKGLNVFIWVILGLMFIIAAALIYILVLTPLTKGVNVADYIRQIINL